MSEETRMEQTSIISIRVRLKSSVAPAPSLASGFQKVMLPYWKRIQVKNTKKTNVKSDPKIPNFTMLVKFLKNSFLRILNPAVKRIIGSAKSKNIYVSN